MRVFLKTPRSGSRQKTMHYTWISMKKLKGLGRSKSKLAVGIVTDFLDRKKFQCFLITFHFRHYDCRFALDLYKNKLLDVDLPFTNPFRFTTSLGYNPRLNVIQSGCIQSLDALTKLRVAALMGKHSLVERICFKIWVHSVLSTELDNLGRG